MCYRDSTAQRPRQTLEVADIFRAYGDAYRATHALAGQQLRVMRAIEQCRTSALGGHLLQCDHCGAYEARYHSCRNRHCPKCQPLAKARWVEARLADLLPIPYFHCVFTLPHPLNPLAQGNPRVFYALLFQAAWDTLHTFGRDPHWLGGDLGATMVLHTWGQNLDQHLHVHCLVTGGALAPEEDRWIPTPRRQFLFPVRALSRVFRGKYLDGLHAAFTQGQLHFAAGTAALEEPTTFVQWLDTLWRQEWVVYAKPPFAGPQQVVAYLGRYTHRIAISHERLVALEDGSVHFRWRDYRQDNAVKVMGLPAAEFIRRFLLHVLPRGFQRLRHYGLLGNRCRAQTLPACRRVLPLAPPPPPGDDRCFHAAAHGHRHPAVSAVPSGAPPGHCPSLSLAAIVGAALNHGSPKRPSAMTSLRHESGFRPSAWWVRGAVCAHAGPGPPLVVSPSPLEDHQLLRTGPGLCPEASADAFAPPLLLSQRVRLALQSPRRLA